MSNELSEGILQKRLAGQRSAATIAAELENAINERSKIPALRAELAEVIGGVIAEENVHVPDPVPRATVKAAIDLVVDAIAKELHACKERHHAFDIADIRVTAAAECESAAMAVLLGSRG